MHPKTLKQGRQPLIPLIPVVATRAGMKLKTKLILLKQPCQLSVCGQQAFLFTAGEKNVRCKCGVDDPNQHVRIVVVAGLTSPRPENRTMVAPLSNPLDGEWPAGDINRRAKRSRKYEQV